MQPQAPGFATPTPPALEGAPRWQVQLLGRFQLSDGQRAYTRLPSRAVMALLARLALWPQRDHTREELAESLWPGCDAPIGRRRLRHTLSLLKDILEPPEHGHAPVLLADRLSLRLVAGTLLCDVHQFERLARSGQPAAALALYPGELLPGHYEEWILVERQRLANLHDRLMERTADEVRAGPASAPTSAAPSLRDRGGAPAPAHELAWGEAIGQRAGGGTLRTDRSTLPDFLTRYVGSTEQLTRLGALVRRHRWVTLLGPGGSGKSRLAVELARQMHVGRTPQMAREDGVKSSVHIANDDAGDDDEGDPFDRVVFVPLASAVLRQDVVDAMARALRIDASNPTFDSLTARLAGWKALLVLDNVEQLSGVAEDLWLRLSTVLPGLHLLFTSRRSLGMDGEQLYTIAPLALPAADASVQAVASSAAVALFVDRATAVRADFHVGPRNHAVLAELVAELEGMPLAIELAASRLRTFSPSDMLKRLRAGAAAPGQTPRLDLLARPNEKSAPDPRHASMLRVIEWTWRQLDGPQRQLAGAMSVFAGGCSLDMLEHVEAGVVQVPLVLDQLLAHSLVQARAAGGADQAGGDDDDRVFQLYEPIREYAAAQFGPEQTACWRARQRDWAIAWGRALPVTPSLPQVRAQLPNIAAALLSATTDDAGDDAVHLLLALGHCLEDVELPLAALAHASAAVDACRDRLLQIRGHSAIAPLLVAGGQKEGALRHAQVPLADPPADPVLYCRALYTAARLQWRTDMRHPQRVLPMVDQAQVLAETAGDPYLTAALLSLRAWLVHASDGDARSALDLQHRALAHWQAFGNRHAVNQGRYNVAVFEFHVGHVERALSQFDEVAAEAATLQDWRRLSAVNDARGNVLSQLRRWPQAVDAFRESLALAWRSMSIYNLSHSLWNLPRALAHLRQPEQALLLAAFSEVFWLEHGSSVLTPAEQRDLLRVRRLAARQLGAGDSAAAWARGRLLSLAEAVAIALAR